MGKALDAAYDRLTVMDIGAACGRVFDFVSGDHGLCKSPFPEYHTNGDKTASFSVTACGKFWKNFAGKNQYAQNGGLLAFARECKPGADDNELREWLVEIAETGHLDKPETAEEKKQRISKWKDEQKRKEAMHRKAQQDSRKAALRLPPPAPPSDPWPDFVRDRYNSGSSSPDYHLAASMVDRLAGHRGWPYEWAEELMETGKISRPRLPWAWTDNQRGWAFKCERPLDAQRGKKVELVSVGYHQRFTREGKKEWRFLPHKLAAKNAKSDFQRQMAGLADPKVEPMPFVIGDLNAPQIVIITEGQWDAATVYGSLGGFEDGDEPLPVCVFGLRGIENASQLLRYWGNWLRYQQMMRNVQSVWILADNDPVGRELIEPKTEAGKLPRPCFKDVIEANFRFRVVGSYLGGGSDRVKDFNDYYRESQPSIAQMWGILERLNLIDNVHA